MDGRAPGRTKDGENGDDLAYMQDLKTFRVFLVKWIFKGKFEQRKLFDDFPEI